MGHTPYQRECPSWSPPGLGEERVTGRVAPCAETCPQVRGHGLVRTLTALIGHKAKTLTKA
jgi:hypothetical protein